MHEQEFERSVQQKMEELSFPPSAPVWEKVSKGLQAGKRKRRFVWWLVPVAVMGIATAIWTFSDPEITTLKTKIQAKNAPQKERVNTSGPVAVAPDKVRADQKNDLQKNSAPARTTDTKTQLSKPYPKPLLKEYTAAVMAPKNKASAVKINVPQQNNGNAAANAFAADRIDVYKDDFVYLARVGQPVPLLSAAFLLQMPQLQTVPAIAPVQVPAILKKVPTVRWLWGFDVQYGRADISGAGLLAANRFDGRNDPAPTGSGSSWGGGRATQPVLQTAPGSFFSTAVYVQRSITNRIALATGIRYSLYTLRLRVGEKINRNNFNLNNASAAVFTSQALYKPDTAKSFFSSHYHQASLPVALQVQPFKKLPLETEAGLAIGYLSGSRILLYDTTVRIYYVARPALKHVQVQAQAAIRYRVARTKQWQWLAGAQMHYHLSGLYQTSNRDKKLYSLSAGIIVRKK